ncbi:MAG: hypothetical protein ABIR83_12370 [Nakamurella sp.]
MHAVIIDEELTVEGVVQDPSRVVRTPSVEILRVLQHLEVGPQNLGSGGELVGSLFQSFLRTLPIDLDLAESGTDLVPRQRIISQEVEQSLLLDVELGQLLFDAGMHLADAALLISHGVLYLGGQDGDEILRQRQRRVVADDGLLDLSRRQVR